MLFQDLQEVDKYDAIWAYSSILHLPYAELVDVIKNAIKEHNVELKTYKEQLTNMVLHRALAEFFDKIDETVDWSSIRRLTICIERINRNIVLLPYTLGEESKLKNEVYFQDAWVEMIRDQTVAILGRIQYEKVKWL